MAEKKRRHVKSKPVKGERFNLFSVLLPTAIILLAYGSYRIYEAVSFVPELPDVDLNLWWGPNISEPHDTSIRQYKIIFSDAMESEFRWMAEAYRGSPKKKSFEDSAWEYGVNSEAFSQFFSYWIFKYSFRDRSRFLNQFDQFKTNIQGLDIHYIHVRPQVPKNVKVIPLLLLHGWPGSVRDFYEAIPLLTTSKPGYDFAFEVIAPSLPGFIFSQAPTRPGLTPFQIAIIMRNLMHRLGHQHYYVQGGDFGHSIGSNMATIFPNEILGFHTNLPINVSKWSAWTWLLGAVWPTFVFGKQADKMYPLTDKAKFYMEEFAYMHLQDTKPDSIGIALNDSPFGLAAYLLDRLMVFTDPQNKITPDGGLEKYFSYDKILDNIMLYWISGSITTAMRLYKETIAKAEEEQTLALIPTEVPTWGLRFKHELAHSPDFVLRWKYLNLIGTTSVECGGHFAAFERPEEFSEDVFKAVKAFIAFRK